MAISEAKQKQSTQIQPFALHAFEKPVNAVDGPFGRAHPHPLANLLGWFSLGVGLAGCIVPEQVARLAGVHKKHAGIFRLLGAREIVTGLGIFTQKMPIPWLWARVGGDAMDMALLGSWLGEKKTNKTMLAATMATVAGVTALDVIAAQRLSSKAGGRLLHVKESIAINRSPEDLYRIWSDFANLPSFMPHLVSIEEKADRRSRWVAKAPFGQTVTWEALISSDEPNHLIAWQTLIGSQVANAGSVRFERGPAAHGSIIHVELRFMPPGGIIGAGIARLFGRAPEQEIHRDLLHFKQVVETGEMPTTDGQTSGRISSQMEKASSTK